MWEDVGKSNWIMHNLGDNNSKVSAISSPEGTKKWKDTGNPKSPLERVP